MERKRSTKIMPRKFEPAVCRSWKREAFKLKNSLMQTEKRQRGNFLRQSGVGAKVAFGGTVFVFLEQPPATCTIPGYEINLRRCHDSYNHMEQGEK